MAKHGDVNDVEKICNSPREMVIVHKQFAP
jgi:hypothetical protein